MNDAKGNDDLVSVIIPAYNASAFLREAIESALAQTYRKLEVIVVDDGSRDNTAAVVESLAVRDPRVRLLRQPNAGVASARNLGLAVSRGGFIALLDADDLWHPEKLARQVAVIRRGSPRLGLVYTWSSVVDEAGRVVDRRGCGVPRYEGEVYAALVLWNFVGNASTPLIRRRCLAEIGGFDVGLRARGAQGCEDLKLYLAIAERYEFAVVPEFLVGYRQTATSMSRSVWQMKRSHALVLADVRRRHPELPGRLFRWSRSLCCYWLAVACWRDRRYLQGAWLGILTVLHDPAFVTRPLLYRRLASRCYWRAVRTVRRVGGPLIRPLRHPRPPRPAVGPPSFLSLPPRQDIRVREETARSELRRHAFIASLRIHPPVLSGPG